MVPVDMSYKEVDIYLCSVISELLAQGPDSCSGINYNNPATFKRNF